MYVIISHPDKNPDPESRKLFVKVANAYEVLLLNSRLELVVVLLRL